MKKLQGLIPIICLMVIAGCHENGPEPKTSPEPDMNLAARRKRLGREEKFRIMVDKVLVIETSDYRMTEDHVRTLAEAGFNVVVPRGGAGDIKDVRRMARLARKHNVFYMPWMGHMLKASLWTKESEKNVWANGTVQDKYSPNSKQLWAWLNDRIIAYAKISKDNPALIGVFLDFENYGWVGGGRWIYDLSYDTTILAEFAEARGIKIPSLKPKRRITWLKENKLHEVFKKFQVSRWRSRCRELRRKVDAIDPKFQFFIYPNVHYSLFMREAAFREWGTKAAPVVVADYHNYFRQDGWHRQAVDRARWLILDAARWVKGHAERCGVEAMVIGGIDPVSDKPMDPEYHGRNAAAIADHSSGYWIFYEFKPMRDKAGRRIVPPVNAEFLKWWTRANRAIAAGRARRFWQAERETPEVAGPPILVGMEGPGLASVILESPGGGAEIRYTIDGSEPKGDSTKYTGTIRITKTTTIQAVAFRAGKQIGSVSKRTVQVPLYIIEAESATLVKPWVVRTGGKEDRRKYILVPKDGEIDLNDPENGALKYRFKVSEAGEYRLVFLLKGPWGAENALYVKVGDGRFMDWYAMTLRREGWYWYRYPGKIKLKRGVNAITIKPKSAGATLDKIAVTKAK